MNKEKFRNLVRKFLKDETGSGIAFAFAIMIMIPLVIAFLIFVSPYLTARECIRRREYLNVVLIFTVAYLPAYFIAYGLFAIYRS
jgi:hypothetical protein